MTTFSTVTIPSTSVEAAFYQPTGKYPPLFYGAPSTHGNMVSVNAGNSQGLYVGGEGINKGFMHALSHQNTGEYATRHLSLLRQARAGGAKSEAYKTEDPTAFSLVDDNHIIKNLNNGNPGGENDGLAFVDIFGKDASGGSLAPHGVSQNTGMLYACPPFGYNYVDDAAFLAACGDMGANCALAIGAYNKIASANGQPLISVMRLCLFSSGYYNTNKVALDKIALAIYDGLSNALIKDDCGLTRVEMPYSTNAHDPLYAAVKAKIDP
ncbi:hypothetical protein [Fretibacter rubidus]|uniref:hypothetical protein n=1 Tax=Fretibacter rubidus TaxID=570162 RepID=UPI00352B460B